jgi:hypothetical protein
MASDPKTVAEVLAGATAGTMSGNTSGNTSDNTSGNTGLSEEIAKLAEQLQQLQAANEAATESKQSSSQASGGSSSDGGSLGQSIGSTLLEVLGGGLGLSPLISGISSLFGGGGDSSVPEPLVRFALPPSLQVDGGVSESGGPAFAVDSPQGGLPRPAPASAPAQITVQVQAMDSRSFLDHSGDIAAAVRQAMLESSVLNDVVREA